MGTHCQGCFCWKAGLSCLDTINKLAILFIMFITNGPKDTTKTYELTDWNKVDNLINSIANF